VIAIWVLYCPSKYKTTEIVLKYCEIRLRRGCKSAASIPLPGARTSYTVLVRDETIQDPAKGSTTYDVYDVGPTTLLRLVPAIHLYRVRA